MTRQEIDQYNNAARAKSVFGLLNAGQVSDLLTIITDLDAKVWETLNNLPETSEEGVQIDFFGYWDENEDRQEAEFYRIRNRLSGGAADRLFEVRQDETNYYKPGHPPVQTWETPGRIDLLTMLLILTHDRKTRPEVYK